jgi:hypothetical protein
VALKPDLFEGLRFEINRPLNQNFFLTHRCAAMTRLFCGARRAATLAAAGSSGTDTVGVLPSCALALCGRPKER